MRSTSKKNKKSIVSVIIYLILLLVSIGFFAIIINVGILPYKYLIPLIIIVLLLYFGLAKLLFNRKVKKWVKIVINFICLILIGIYAFLFYYLSSTIDFMNFIGAESYQLDNYYVLVKKDSTYKELKDIDVLGIYKSDSKEYEKAIDEIDKETKVEKEEYTDYVELSYALLEGKVDGILISASYSDILLELVPEFSDTQNIKTIEIKVKSKINVNEDIDVTKTPFNIYVSGIDVYGEIETVSRSDVNMVVTVNPISNKIHLTSIPRDYYVQLHGTSGTKDKLTHAGLYGVNTSIETIEDLLETEIDYYVRVNFTTVIDLVDAIGGIEVYSDKSFTAWTNRKCKFKKGTNKLDGKCALAFARERYAYSGGDRHRVKNQQDVLSAIMKKTMTSKTLISKYTTILKSLKKNFQTNIPNDSIYALINMQIDSMPSWQITQYSLNGTDKNAATYTFGSRKLYVMQPDMKTVEEAKQKIDDVLTSHKVSE